jgi:hypothetical protein
MTKNNAIVTFFFLFSWLGCTNRTPEKALAKPTSRALAFLDAKNFKIYRSKGQIPAIVVDSLSSINGEKFKIGDTSDVGKISFADIHIDGIEYNKGLQFILLNDTLCLLSYREGGIGSHDVIDFIQYKGEFGHTRYMTTALLGDTALLGKYLRTNPKPEFEAIE